MQAPIEPGRRKRDSVSAAQENKTAGQNVHKAAVLTEGFDNSDPDRDREERTHISESVQSPAWRQGRLHSESVEDASSTLPLLGTELNISLASLRLHEDGFERAHVVRLKAASPEPRVGPYRIKTRFELDRRVQDLQSCREHIQGTRAQVQETRAGLRIDRNALKDSDANIIQKLRRAFPRKATWQSLLDEFENVQEQRNNYQDREDDFEKLEDQLMREEFKLQQYESDLYDRSGGAHTSLLGDEESTILPNDYEPNEPTEPTEDNASSLTSSPWVEKELSSLLDRGRALEESLVELGDIRSQLVEEERNRAQVGLDPIEESQDFLNRYEEDRGVLQEELKVVIYRAKKMRSIIYFNTVLRHSQFDGKDSSEALDQTVDPVPQNDPLLVDHDFAPLFSTLPCKDDMSANKQTFINEWLLHRLRRSSIEIFRFKSDEILANLNISQERFRDLLLEWWPKDDASSDFLRAEEVGGRLHGSLALTNGSKQVEQNTKSRTYLSTTGRQLTWSETES